MADRTSSDLPENGATAGPQDSVTERERTHADSDQSASDTDQTAADSDQASSDRDLAYSGDPAVHDLTRDVRDDSAPPRGQTAKLRAESALARDTAAHVRDLAGLKRDQVAAQQDRELAARDATWASNRRPGAGADVLLRAGQYRKLAAADRIAAAQYRAGAAADREQAARDRDQGARDRVQDEADRDALVRQLEIAETDHLTGARTRSAGLTDLEHEVERARRTTGRLAVGYIDVVGLKTVNDAHGHAAGDALLQHVIHAIREQLRPYDLIVRMGGDEFLCAMSNATRESASQRFGAIQTTLATDHDACEIRVGVAALTPQDTVTELIAHADAALPAGSRR